MTRYPLSAYGPDPKNRWLENSANGWGAYAWPAGVPASLRGTVKTRDGTNIHVRRELVPLVQVLADITEAHGYAMHTATGGNTGGYSNRPVRGGTGPSTHSRARAVDIRALDNPQSWTFICTIPPAVVHAWEACGFYWGGRYTGVQYDPQHFSYIHTPARVAADLARARTILAALTPIEEDDMPTLKEITDALTPIIEAAAKAGAVAALKEPGVVNYEDSRLRPTVKRSESVAQAIGRGNVYASNASGGVDQLARLQGAEPEDRKG